MTYARVFVDTSAWFALLVANDTFHDKISGTYTELYQQGGRFITSSLVLGELYTLLTARREFTDAYWAFHTKLAFSDRVQLVHLTGPQMDATFSLLRERPDKAYSFVDASSFVLMRDKAVDTALTLDHHFAQEGFHIVPARNEYIHEATEIYNQS